MKMSHIGVAAITVITLFASQAMAEECSLSRDCAAGEFCVNFECAVPAAKMSECQDATDCDHMFTCISGTCKPDGVYCETITGWQVIGATGSSLSCIDGIGRGSMSTGSSTDMDCDNCEPISILDYSAAELAELQELCLSDLDSTCGTEIPVPEEQCSPDALKICTDWLIIQDEVELNCEDEFEEKAAERDSDDSTSEDGDKPTSPPDADMKEDIDKDAGEESGSTGIAGIVSMRGLESSVSPWAVIDCCEEIEEDDEDAAALSVFVNCVNEATAEDCDAIWACFEENWEYFGYTDALASGGNDRDEEKDDVTNGDGPTDSNTAVDGEEADGADGAATGSGSDSGCTITAPGTDAPSLLSILLG